MTIYIVGCQAQFFPGKFVSSLAFHQGSDKMRPVLIELEISNSIATLGHTNFSILWFFLTPSEFAFEVSLRPFVFCLHIYLRLSVIVPHEQGVKIRDFCEGHSFNLCLAPHKVSIQSEPWRNRRRLLSKQLVYFSDATTEGYKSKWTLIVLCIFSLSISF